MAMAEAFRFKTRRWTSDSLRRSVLQAGQMPFVVKTRLSHIGQSSIPVDTLTCSPTPSTATKN
jgi:hypothetical protein